MLLDLSSTFDTVDQDRCIGHLEKWVGLQRAALSWFISYLKHRTFSVNTGSYFSSSADVSCGVPQGCILGPLLFSLYVLPLAQIIRKHNVSFHFCANNIQLYFPIRPNEYEYIYEVRHKYMYVFLLLLFTYVTCLLDHRNILSARRNLY